ncbi:MAG: protein-L-isoaspartate(D-aspartate) O-methyltransferase [Alphaproteobacteria bacterium]|nr:protein-L-isoaspartate(D-aspartate) O-methyltransferase [Alphaproteobacteria bacterium]
MKNDASILSSVDDITPAARRENAAFGSAFDSGSKANRNERQPLFHHVPANLAAQDEVSNRLRLLMTLRRSGVGDTAVLSAMENVPREMFVEEAFADHAWDDTALPISCGQTLSQPTVVAWMTAALAVSPRMRVLEIGTGSGYQTSILARMSRRVYTVERHRDLLSQAENRFSQLRLNNIVTKCGDGSKGWKETAPFERIMVTAAAREIPAVLLEQLAPNGVMVLPVGHNVAEQILLRIRKDEAGAISTEHLMNVRFVPLVEG